MTQTITNVLTIDLEDYYMVSAFESVVRREDWRNYQSRIERNTRRLLEILFEAKPHSPELESGNPEPSTPHPLPGIKATFFCLGWVAENYPGLIKEIAGQGHEIANHSYDHRLVYGMTPAEFRNDIRKTKKILEDITGKEVIGYRAPSYSITDKSLWALQILAEEGYRYDSSIFPIHHDRYGIPTAPRLPFVIGHDNGWDLRFTESLNSYNTEHDNFRGKQTNNHFLIEFPISTVRYLGKNAPVSGGGYFRLFPYPLIKGALKKINHQDKSPFVIYLHPWELDPEQPRFDNASVLSRFRHYVNLDKTHNKIEKLLTDFNFSSMHEILF